MSKKILILSLVLGVSISASNVRAEEGVYIDLSVLNDLSPSSDFPAVSTQPLFPEVKKAPRKASGVKAKKAPKINKIKVVEKKVAPIIEAPKVEPAPIVAEPKPVEIEVNREFIAEIEQDSTPKAPTIVESAPEVAPTPVSAPVETSEMAPEPVPFATETIVPPEKINAATIEPVTSMEMPADESEASGASESILPKEIAPVEPLIPAVSPETPVANIPNQLYFAEDTYELTPAHKAQVDTIIKGFENMDKNKVLILSYNFDDGQDVFKKKRQSLNRAIEIRSYLLAQGYKNFSIKVINVTDDASKRNRIEIEELK